MLRWGLFRVDFEVSWIFFQNFSGLKIILVILRFSTCSNIDRFQLEKLNFTLLIRNIS